jgi:hypothetical protein
MAKQKAVQRNQLPVKKLSIISVMRSSTYPHLERGWHWRIDCADPGLRPAGGTRLQTCSARATVWDTKITVESTRPVSATSVV